MSTEHQEMDHIQPDEREIEQQEKKLEISNEVTTYLNEAGKWGKFLAIMGFVFMGLMVIAGFIMSIVFAFLPKESFGGMPFPSFLIGIIYLVIGAIYLIPILYLYRFSTGIKTALTQKNQNQFVKAFYNLKSLYRFIGIFMIIILALYLLTFIIMIFAGLFAGISSFTGMQT